MPAVEITIRAWQPADRTHVQALLGLLSAEAQVTDPEAPAYVAVVDGTVAGMVTLCVFHTLTGTKAYLDHLVVAPEHRRRGIGRALVEHAIARAVEAGASRIDLTAGAGKDAGRALYESLGFRRRETSVYRLPLDR